MGGYTGDSVFIAAYNGGVIASKLEGPGHDYVSRMCFKTSAPLQAELIARPASMAPNTIANSLADEIEKLGALRDKGLLTQAEFEEEKVKLLSR